MSLLDTTIEGIISNFFDQFDLEEEIVDQFKNVLESILIENLTNFEEALKNEIESSMLTKLASERQYQQLATPVPAAGKKKRAPTHYNLFMQKYIAEHKGQGKPNAELFKEGSQIWHSLSDEDKRPFVEESSRLKKELEASNALVTPISASGGAAAAGKKKRAPSAYNLYIKELSAQFKGQGKPQSEIFKTGGAKWKSLSEEEKRPYVEESNRLKLELQGS